jgi:hypothetical protein
VLPKAPPVRIDVMRWARLPCVLPMAGNRRCTAVRTRLFSLGDPNWLTRERALRAWLASAIGYRRPGSAKLPGDNVARVAVVSFARLRLRQRLRAVRFVRVRDGQGRTIAPRRGRRLVGRRRLVAALVHDVVAMRVGRLSLLRGHDVPPRRLDVQKDKKPGGLSA